MAAPRTARDRIRAELTEEILQVAKVHLARDGAAALSLRSIARDLEMAPSALYRYFSGRDALLTALILDAYTSLADVAEAAADAAADPAADPAAARSHSGSGPDDLERWSSVLHCMRKWALTHPHEWGLIFGSPVPGYQAPEATVVPYARLASALVRPVVEAHAKGRLDARGLGSLPGPESDWTASFAPIEEGLLPGLPPVVVARVLQAWASMVGLISLELFGHWNQTVLNPELLFDDAVRTTARSVGLLTDV
ncbi:MAG TPA: TetR/AcrR family transcriptional regulator [Acidimicrobiales bacterium]|jgi:AcrR family transcriptional regulator